MMRAFLYRFILVACIFALCAPCLANAGDAPSDDIKKAARDGLNTYFKNKKINSNLKKQGFESQADLDIADLGEGFQIYTINLDRFQDASAPNDLQSLPTATNQWKFLVISRGKAKALLYLTLLEGRWHSHDPGRSPLAKEIEGIMTAWPASAGYSYRYVRALAASTEYMELSKEGKVVGIIPLSALMAKSGRVAGEIKPVDLRDPQDFLTELRLRFKKNSDPFNPSDEVMTAAREGLISELKGYKVDDRRMFGFETQTDIDNAELGEGFQEFNISIDKLLDESASLDFESLVCPTGEWHFPIVADGRTVSLLNCRFAHGQWRCGGLGPAGLASEVSGLRAAWPASAGYRFKYIGTLPSAKYIELSQGGKVLGVFPLSTLFRTPGRAEGEYKTGYMRDPQEVLKELRMKIKKNIQYHKERQQRNVVP